MTEFRQVYCDSLLTANAVRVEGRAASAAGLCVSAGDARDAWSDAKAKIARAVYSDSSAWPALVEFRTCGPQERADAILCVWSFVSPVKC